MYGKQVGCTNENGAMEKPYNSKGWPLAAEGMSINAASTTY